MRDGFDIVNLYAVIESEEMVRDSGSSRPAIMVMGTLVREKAFFCLLRGVLKFLEGQGFSLSIKICTTLSLSWHNS